ncbi:MAG TPA: hypothetical protein VF053_07275 [Streptosporangiales bacterium]
MLRRSHRRRPPVPVWVAVALLLVAAGAVGTAAVVRDPWLLRATVAALAVVVVVDAILMYRVRRMLRRTQVRLAGVNSALARVESRAARERIGRQQELATLNRHLELAQAQLREVTGASLHAAAVLAELLRNNVYLADGASAPAGADEPDPSAGDGDAESQDSPGERVGSTVVQVWPSVDDAPTVVDLVRWDQLRRMTDEPATKGRRPA